MKSPPSSWILICLSFIFFLNITMSENSYKVGQSASISCSVQSKEDIRELSFCKGHDIIFTLWVKDGNLSIDLEVSGTFDDFTWTLNRTDQCINGNSVGSPTLGCSHPDSDASIIELSDGSEKMASLLIDSNYKSRIQVSGTIRNSTITLTGLIEKDKGYYGCRWKKLNLSELIEGVENFLAVENPPPRLTNRGWILIGILIGVALALCVLICFYRKEMKNYVNILKSRCSNCGQTI